jgi:hypothetical protein
MDSKKILIVSSAFYPENSPRSFRTTELLKELGRQGHQVTIYTLRDEVLHPPIEQEFGVKIKDLGPRKLPVINVRSSGKVLSLFKRILNRVLLQLISYPDIELMFMVKRALAKEEQQYDLLISIAVPHQIHWGTAWAKTKSHPLAKKWVADCGDPFMGAIHDSFNKLFYFKYLEKWFCRKADYIAVPKLAMKENYYAEFRNKVIEIPQGFKFDDVVLSEFSKNEVPTFGFAGTFLPTTRNPVPLLEYLLTVKKPFKFVIYTETQDLVLPFLPLLKERLVLRRYIPRMELLKEFSAMDFLVNISYDPVHQAPSKLIDYYLTKRPILSSTTNKFDTAIVAEFLDGNYSNAFVASNIEQYRIENVAKSFSSIAPE